MSADTDDELDVEFLSWKLFEVGIPIIILFVAYFTAIFAFNIRHAFISTFASGDLLPITTVVLLGCTVEMDRFLVFASSAGERRRAQKQKNWNLAVVIVVAMIFGVVKGAGLETLDMLDGGESSHRPVWYDIHLILWTAHANEYQIKLWGFALFSFVVGAFQLLLAYYSKTQLLTLMVKKEGKTS